MINQQEEQSMVRVRFAPSPTGEMHIGNLRTALYNYLFARHHKGVFVVRIEDTDQERKVENAVERLVETLHRFGLDPDEGPVFTEKGIEYKGEYGPYVQSERLALYKDAAEILLEKGHAYYCFCSQERLESLRKIQQQKGIPTRYDGHCRSLSKEEVAKLFEQHTSHVIRLKVPTTGVLSFSDAIRGEVTFAYDTIDDQVLMKSDGFPTYHLANVVDDHEMKITHVLRAEEWLPSTPKHILLYSFFGWKAPTFAHLPMLLDATRAKLSKRRGAKSAEQYLESGFLPQALLNFILFLGWNPKTNEEIFSRESMIEQFTLDKINMSGAIVNDQKLLWFNQHYLKAASAELITDYCFANSFLPAEWKEKTKIKTWPVFLGYIKERLEQLTNLKDEAVYFFEEPEYDQTLLLNKNLTKDECEIRLKALYDCLSGIPHWPTVTTDDFRQLIETELIEKKELKRGSVLWPLRVALTGRPFSPGAYELLPIFSKEVVLGRIRKALSLL